MLSIVIILSDDVCFLLGGVIMTFTVNVFLDVVKMYSLANCFLFVPYVICIPFLHFLSSFGLSLLQHFISLFWFISCFVTLFLALLFMV